MHLETILRQAHELDASDVHLVAGHKPMLRIHTVMHPLEHEVLTPEAMERALESLISPNQLKIFAENNDLDFSHEIEGVGRYRANAHRQRQGVGIAMRLVRTKIPPMSELTLPDVISRLTYLPRGLVLVTGDTGSGKSTTLAAMIQTMNERYRKHIITLEDPWLRPCPLGAGRANDPP